MVGACGGARERAKGRGLSGGPGPAGRYDEALSWAELALREGPNCKPALRIGAASQALLGRMDDARMTIRRMSRIDPDFRLHDVRKVAPLRRPEHLATFEEGLRKAGLAD